MNPSRFRAMHIEHDAVTRRFLAQLPSGTAILSYAPAKPGVLELYSTFVPVPDRGHGIGGHLVEAALGYARENQMRIIPTCRFVAQWIREHPEDGDLLADGRRGGQADGHPG